MSLFLKGVPSASTSAGLVADIVPTTLDEDIVASVSSVDIAPGSSQANENYVLVTSSDDELKDLVRTLNSQVEGNMITNTMILLLAYHEAFVYEVNFTIFVFV